MSSENELTFFISKWLEEDRNNEELDRWLQIRTYKVYQNWFRIKEALDIWIENL